MQDILDLEQSYEQLGKFLESCLMPSARAVAIARFVESVPRDLQGRSYYMAEIGPWMAEALRDESHICWDPEYIRTIDDTISELAEAEVFAPGEIDQLREQVRQRKGFRRRGAGGAHEWPAIASSDSAIASTQLCLPVPLVCQIPGIPGREDDSDYVGSMVALTVALRTKAPQADPITWNNGNALQATADLRSFHDVAADVRVAAREAMHRVVEGTEALSGGLTVKREAFQRYDLDRLGFDLSIPEKQMGLAGDSIGLALAVAMAGAMVGVLTGGRALHPRADLAWTGVVLPSGETLQVERSSLAAKIRVSHAAGLKGIVVPGGMGMFAEQVMRRCRLDGEVFEVGSIQEALTHGGLMEVWDMPGPLTQSFRRPVLGKYVAIVAIAVILVAALGFLPRGLDEFDVHWFPFWRPFPSTERLRVPDNFWHGIQIDLPFIRDIVMKPPPQRMIAFAQISDNLGGKLRGRPCLVYGASMNTWQGLPGFVAIHDLRQDRNVLTKEILCSEVPYEPRDSLHDACYTVKMGRVGDIDRDGSDEIVVATSANPHSVTALQILEDDDAGGLACNGSVIHPGHLEHILHYDFDDDGQVEIVSLGFHGPSQGMSVLVLHREHFYPALTDDAPTAPTAEQWSMTEQPCVAHLVVPMLPGYAGVSGVTHLGPFILGLRESEEHGMLIRGELGAGVGGSDYLMTFFPNLDVAQITVNQSMRDQSYRWQKSGVATDFASSEFIDRWQRLFRRTSTIQMGWVQPAGDGVGPAESETSAGEEDMHDTGR